MNHTGSPNEHKFSKRKIPEELRGEDRWIGWRFGPDRPGGKPSKIPIQANGQRANVTNPRHFGPFSEADAIRKAASLDGIGFVLGSASGGKHFAGIDLDDCR